MVELKEGRPFNVIVLLCQLLSRHPDVAVLLRLLHVTVLLWVNFSLI